MSVKDTQISLSELKRTINRACRRFRSNKQAQVIAEMVAKAEAMGVKSHGLHYFLHSIWPLLSQSHVEKHRTTIKGSAVYSNGNGGVGFANALAVLRKTSTVAKKKGVAIAIFKNPGKVGALRTYCQEFMKKGQLIMIIKNTAPTVGLPVTASPLIGTNPLCIGLPGSRFIYDACTATVATNKVRLLRKKGKKFKVPVGVNKYGRLTNDPEIILGNDGFLLPFNYRDFWFKSFFLGAAIECMAVLAGGRASVRVGPHKGRRLYSKEGMVAIIIDKKTFPDYKNYLKETKLFFKDLLKYKLKIPGSFSSSAGKVKVLKKDWEEVRKI